MSILEGIRKRLGDGAAVKHAEGVRITEDSAFTRDPQPLIGKTRLRARASADRSDRVRIRIPRKLLQCCNSNRSRFSLGPARRASRNGTWVDGVRIACTPVEVTEASEIAFAQLRFRVRRG